MTRLKRWESPRAMGRNHKGRGGSAKQRQQRQRNQRLRQKLQSGLINNPPKERSLTSLFYCG